MGREEQIIQERLKKIEGLREQGINPYPNQFDKKNTAEECVKSKLKTKVKTAGRLMTKRDLGRISFASLQDQTGKIQLVVQEGETPEQIKTFFKKSVDAGDFVGVEGTIMKSKTGEISILVKKVEILSKAVLPLPEKWHGIKDEEEKFRKRYLDILMNPEVKEIFIKKSKFWGTIRNFLNERGFLEVETPVLENSAGGASATPFSTHHNALDIDVFLRISMGELWQKKLMVAGYEKTFEIGRQFRNEGMDMEHLQDYTQMEFYWAYANYKDGMKLAEEMYKKVVKEVLGTLKFETHGYKVDLGKKWETYDYEELIKKNTKINIYSATEKDIKKKLDELKVEYDPNVDKWRLVDGLWKYCRKKLAGPGFLINQPVEVSPLAKRNSEDPKKVEQFQVIIAGTELGNGYSELNDPIDQENRFEKQNEMKEAGDTEAQDHDKGFVEALKHGMPPVCGFGVSERLFSYIMDKPIRECVAFPLMRPEENGNKSTTNKKRNTTLPLSRNEAVKLLKKQGQKESDMHHYLESEAVMKSLANKFGEDEKYWAMLGLLHDIDWAMTKENTKKHCIEAKKILKDSGFDDDFIEVIQSHGYGFKEIPELKDEQRTEKIEHALAAAETITGLIYAYALMRGGKISDMEIKGLKKKFNDKKFAENCNRNIIREIEKTGLDLNEFFQIAISSIKDIKDQIGLS